MSFTPIVHHNEEEAVLSERVEQMKSSTKKKYIT